MIMLIHSSERIFNSNCYTDTLYSDDGIVSTSIPFNPIDFNIFFDINYSELNDIYNWIISYNIYINISKSKCMFLFLFECQDTWGMQ